METTTPIKTSKTKKKKFVPHGQAHIQATYNNTIVTMTDSKGDVIATTSAGQLGFKGPKKSTPYAASLVVRNLLEKIRESGLKEVDVFVKGVGAGREAAIRAFPANGISILSIRDMTPIPHNGPRPKKPRRV